MMASATHHAAEEKIVCVGCYQQLVGDGVPCPTCHWPMCGNPECWEETSDHALGECMVLSKPREYPFDEMIESQGLNHVYLSLLVLRSLALRDRDPIKWKYLTNVDHRVAEQHLAPFKEEVRNHAGYIINQWLMPGRVDYKLIEQILLSLMVKLPTEQEVR